MNVILIILVAIAGIIVLLLIIGLFSKKDYLISREVIINRPKNVVFDYIKYIGNSENYSKWVMADPHSKKAHRGTDGTVGFVYSWDSEMKNVGAGEQEIVSISDGERIAYALRFIRPFKGNSEAIMTTESISEESTKVRWSFSSTMNYPMNIMMLFVNFENILGRDMEISLQNLKSILERQ